MKYLICKPDFRLFAFGLMAAMVAVQTFAEDRESEFNPFVPTVISANETVDFNPFQKLEVVSEVPPVSRTVRSTKQSPVENNVATVAVNGELWELESFVMANYERPWTYSGTVEQQLANRGIQPEVVTPLDHRERQRLFSAICEAELKSSMKERNREQCVNGNCYSPAYSPPTSKWRLFTR